MVNGKTKCKAYFPKSFCLMSALAMFSHTPHLVHCSNFTLQYEKHLQEFTGDL